MRIFECPFKGSYNNNNNKRKLLPFVSLLLEIHLDELPNKNSIAKFFYIFFKFVFCFESRKSISSLGNAKRHQIKQSSDKRVYLMIHKLVRGFILNLQKKATNCIMKQVTGFIKNLND